MMKLRTVCIGWMCGVFMMIVATSAWAANSEDIIKTLKDTGLNIGTVKEATGNATDADKSSTEGEAASADEGQTVQGLKEALNVGIQEAVKRVGVTDGFYKNAAIKILLPEKLQKADAVVRQLGGEQLSEALVKKMNEAAEKAAPQAQEIFVTAIKGMKFDDAMKILSGEDNAATAYLEEHTSDSLKTSFYPIVKTTMEEVGTIKAYNEYMGKYTSNPLMKMLDLDISQYVTDKGVDGLFKMVAEEEMKIRKNPAARVTDLLKSVFGGLKE